MNYKPEDKDEDNIVYPPRVIFKFKEGKAPPYQSDIEGYDSLGDYIQKKDLGPWDALAEKMPGISVQLIFVGVSVETINNLIKRASDTDPSYPDPHFLSYFAIQYEQVPEGASYKELLNNMQQIREAVSSWGSVELAYVEPGLAPLPSVPTLANNNQMDQQGYLNPASQGGVDAKAAWAQAGGGGANIDFIDIERGWDLAHQDLIAPAISLLFGNNKEAKMHGTSTLGVVAGRDNGANTVGIVGIAYEANAKVISIFPTATSVNPDHSNAIMTALSYLNYGDVLLIEDQRKEGTRVVNNITFDKLWPMETAPLIWEVIYLGTTLGIIIIEPTGNGLQSSTNPIPLVTDGNDLASFTDSSSKHILDRNPASSHYGEFKDSRAIVVGAATEGEQNNPQKHTRTVQTQTALPSNFGKRIDCFGWGESVWTAGGGTDAAPTHNSYRFFDGTSSASAMVAGVALVIQSLAEQKLKFRLGPLRMRDLLSNPAYGTPVYTPSDLAPYSVIEGYMPDLQKILNAYFGVFHEDIFIRDNPTDIGDSHTGALSISPDIIVRNSTSPNDYIANPNLDDSDAKITGASAHIYVRAFNRGNAIAKDVKVRLYYSEVASLVTPANWHLITINDVPLGDILEKTGSTNVSSTNVKFVQIPWSNVPGSGHYCFIGLVGNDNDPMIDPTQPSAVNFYNDFENFRRFIRENNNVTWKNFNVVSNSGTGTGGSGFIELDFFVAGANDQHRPMGLEIVSKLPKGARVWLQGRDDFLFTLQGKATPNLEHDKEKRTARILVNPYGPYRFIKTVFPKDLRERLILIVDLPKEHRDKTYELYARQLYQGEEVGRVTWQITPPDLIRDHGFTPAERRCVRLRWLLVGLLSLLVVVVGLHPFTNYLAEIIVGLGVILAGFIWYRNCRPGKETILKAVALGFGIGIVLLAGVQLVGLS
jgi:serine protease